MRGSLTRLAGPVTVVGLLFTLVGCGHLMKPRFDAGPDGCGADAACPYGELCPDNAKVCKHPTLMALGHDLDHLEKHIDWYGSVVPKVPDVWGQARLTEHREQFEAQMKDELDEFELGLHGSLARTDQAFFAHATALSLAAQPKPPLIGRVVAAPPPAPAPPAPPTLVPIAVEVVTAAEAGRQPTTTTTRMFGPAPATETPAPAPATTVEMVKAPDAADPTTLLTDPDGAIVRSDLTAPRQVGFTTIAAAGIGIEPTLRLAQKKRYLDFLNQIRRENEGDDTADAPGYSLNLMRIPVSVLPGKRTDTGHGAEVTMTLTPVLGDDLLPVTYRSLVTNDLLQQLGFPLTQFLNTDNRETVGRVLTSDIKQVVIGLPVLNRINEILLTTPEKEAFQAARLFVKHLPDEDKNRLKLMAGQAAAAEQKQFLLSLLADDTDLPNFPAQSATAQPRTDEMKRVQDYKASMREEPNAVVGKIDLALSVPALSFSPGLTNKTGFPTSQLLDVYGLSNCFQIAFAANTALTESIVRQQYAHLPDVQGFLQQEIAAAYEFLAQPECAHLWQNFCTPDVVAAVRTRKVGQVQAYREQFRAAVEVITQSTPEFRERRPYNDRGDYSTTAALAWCVLVDSALLTDRLRQDMREAASARGKVFPWCDQWLPYFLPTPPPEARQAFAEYVALRWPIRVFALDPAAEDQNIADALSTRRETQLALSIAFTNGVINANQLTRYTRRLEAEYETVALNRTQVGFGHGENVFGWRFYPRFQTPETESNAVVLLRDQLLGGPNRNALLRDRRLEPGQRECVAVVLMPSFVPYAELDTVSNWFSLAHPKHKVLDHTQALRLSRTVRTLKNCGYDVTDAECYRDGEFTRMIRRIDQLEARLPTQTQTVPVPVLNTLGGFEMFGNGTTDLAPELYGWYGAPGVSRTTTTSLYLVGDHFSPLHTYAIVGNKKAKVELLSRQVARVEVDPAAIPLTGDTHVQAQIATPYGVSRELIIPVAGAAKKEAPAPKEGYALDPNEVAVAYRLMPSLLHPGTFQFAEVRAVKPTKITIAWDDATGSVPHKLDVRFTFAWKGGAVTVPPCVALPVATTNGTFTIGENELKLVAQSLIKAIQADGLKPGENPFDAPFVTTKVEVTPVADGVHAVQTKTVSNQLKLTFTPEYAEGQCLPPGCPVMPPPIPPATYGPAPEPASAAPGVN